MPRFHYIARSRTGERLEGTVEATDKRTALLQIERQGHVPVAVHETAGATAPAPAAPAAAPRPGRKRFRLEPRAAHAPRMKMRDVVMFTRELSDLLASGMTLGNALHTLSKRKTGKAQDQIILTMRDDIVQGTSLSETLAKRPETFSPLYVNLVRAGEASGQMAQVLERLCTYYEMVQGAQEKVVAALIYPGIVLGMGVGTMIFTMVFVVPRFTAIFKELGSTLPLATQLLMGLSTVMLRYGWAIALGVVGLVVLFRRHVRTPAGRRQWDRFQMRVPVFRNIITANAFSQFARTLESLLTNGVPVLQALAIVQETVGNTVIAEEIRAARERVTDGASISGPLAQGQVFPRILTDMLAVGEETGDIGAALGHIAHRYENELDRSVKVLTTVLEPILILLMALMVGFVAVSMLLAIFNLTSGLNV